MKVPVSWLKELIPVSYSVKRLCEVLTMSGTAVEGTEGVEGETVLSCEVTTNRPDCLSLLGIAQELQALTGKKLKSPKQASLKVPSKKGLPLKIKIVDKKGCPGYTARVLDVCEAGPSPKWLVDHLKWVGQNSVNNIVDVTNYCLFEIGQPLHAFDYDKIRGGQIIVRRAQKGETMLGLDNVRYELNEGILVIADAERPIAIAGVIGGKDTEVTEKTKRIALESARFSPVLVRRASRALKVQTDSSYRFERTVDPQKVTQGSNRASLLIQEVAHAEVASGLLIAGSVKAPKASWISLRKERLDRLMGHEVPLTKTAQILKALGFKVKKSQKKLSVQSPSHRPDIKEEVDLIEEVIRIYGFEKIPAQIPITRHATQENGAFNLYEALRRMRESLVSQGFWEAVTFSLVSGESLSRMGFKEEGVLKIKNPLSKEQEFLQPTGLAGLLDAASRNVNRKEKDVQFFEISNRFNGNKEETILSLIVTGTFYAGWDGARESSFYHLKGVIENLFSYMKRQIPEWNQESHWPETLNETLLLYHEDKPFAMCSEVRPDVLDHWNVVNPVYYAEVVLDDFFSLEVVQRSYEEIPKFPPARRDIAFIIDKDIPLLEVEKLIRQTGHPELVNVALFDEFQGKSIPKNKRSLAFTIQYQKLDGTFTDEEINQIHQRITRGLESQYRITLRQ